MLERPKRRLSVSGTGSGEIERNHGHHAVIESARHNFSIKMHSASSAIPPAISRGSDAAEELSTQEYLKTKRKLAA